MNHIINESFLGLDHPSAQDVLEIAKDVLDHNKLLNRDDLYNIAKNKLNIPRKGLLRIINNLFNKRVLIEGSKYTKSLF